MHLWYHKQPVGIIWNKVPLVLMNYLVVIFFHLKKTTGCFIHNVGLDLSCVKSTCCTKSNLWVLFGIKHHWFRWITWWLFFLTLKNHWLFYPGLDLNCFKIHLWYQKQPVGIIWNKVPLVLMNYLVVIFFHLKKTTGCFIHNVGLDLSCVKSTCCTKSNLWVLFGIKHHWFRWITWWLFFLTLKNHWLFYPGLDLNCVKFTCGTKNNQWVLFGIKHHWF